MPTLAQFLITLALIFCAYKVGWYVRHDNPPRIRRSSPKYINTGFKPLTSRHDESGSDVLRSKGL